MNKERFDLRGEINTVKTITGMGLDAERRKDDEEDPDKWGYYDSSYEHFNSSFRNVFPKDSPNFNSYIERVYGNQKGNLVGIELGGPGVNLFKDLAPGYFKKTAGFTLTKPLGFEASKHEIIEADVFAKRNKDKEIDGYQKVQSWVKENGKADIVIERMIAPLTHIESDEYMELLFKRWYRLLGNEGTMFIQAIGQANYNKLVLMAEFYRDKLEIQYTNEGGGNYDTNGEFPGLFIRLRKLPGAPDSLDELFKGQDD